MKNIHLLPTTKDQHSIIQKNTGLLLIQTPGKDYSGKKLNLYITLDEVIKDVRPYKGKWQLEQGEILNKFPTYLTDLSECKLVIMTTDQDLIADGVQAIDDEFLKWFVKNPSCEKVEVTKDLIQIDQSNPVTNGSTALVQKYKIIIPQEEPKQELLEDAAEKEYGESKKDLTSDLDKIMYKCYMEGTKFGAKWQAERMYSEEEVFNLCRGFAIFVVQTGASYEKQIQWFEQNKKK